MKLQSAMSFFIVTSAVAFWLWFAFVCLFSKTTLDLRTDKESGQPYTWTGPFYDGKF